ncbi:hypothetical protein AZE42_07570 [Rhizopogon vesiculosus]|uniref:Uncharacterized protein n=1 Tax=Rhizopogon vesiculosus TaxID=180088 RepID=A0A1J8PKI1_9AGAM|nr:hypothetical protein AZE42_07570 [Rhizopogon vesiculosus]
MLIDVSIYSPISPPRHSVAHFADESLCPSSRPPYVPTQQPLSTRNSLGHGLSHDFAIGGTYSDVGHVLNAFRSYANLFHKLVVLVIAKVCQEMLSYIPNRTYFGDTELGVGRVWAYSLTAETDLTSSTMRLFHSQHIWPRGNVFKSFRLLREDWGIHNTKTETFHGCRHLTNVRRQSRNVSREALWTWTRVAVLIH